MKLLKYVMTTDAGLAPNPYGHVCTLALCTPNHSNSRLNVGDWIVGHSDKRWGRKLIYAMKVTHILSMEEYFNECPDKRPDWKSLNGKNCAATTFTTRKRVDGPDFHRLATTRRRILLKMSTSRYSSPREMRISFTSGGTRRISPMNLSF